MRWNLPPPPSRAAAVPTRISFSVAPDDRISEFRVVVVDGRRGFLLPESRRCRHRHRGMRHHRETASIRNPRNDDEMMIISTRRHSQNIYFLLLFLLSLALLVLARTMSDTTAAAVRWVRTMMMMMPCSEEEDGGGIGPEEARRRRRRRRRLRRRTERPTMGDADGEESYGPNIIIVARTPSSLVRTPPPPVRRHYQIAAPGRDPHPNSGILTLP